VRLSLFSISSAAVLTTSTRIAKRSPYSDVRLSGSTSTARTNALDSRPRRRRLPNAACERTAETEPPVRFASPHCPASRSRWRWCSSCFCLVRYPPRAARTSTRDHKLYGVRARGAGPSRRTWFAHPIRAFRREARVFAQELRARSLPFGRVPSTATADCVGSRPRRTPAQIQPAFPARSARPCRRICGIYGLGAEPALPVARVRAGTGRGRGGQATRGPQRQSLTELLSGVCYRRSGRVSLLGAGHWLPNGLAGSRAGR